MHVCVYIYIYIYIYLILSISISLLSLISLSYLLSLSLSLSRARVWCVWRARARSLARAGGPFPALFPALAPFFFCLFLLIPALLLSSGCVNTMTASTANHLWSLDDVLGQGATASVYKARNKVLYHYYSFPIFFTQTGHALLNDVLYCCRKQVSWLP